MKQLPLQGVEPVKANVIDDAKALAQALWEQVLAITSPHPKLTSYLLGAFFGVVCLVLLANLPTPQVTADTLTPAIENMVRQDCAGILNAKGVTDDGKVKACQALASQHNVKLKGIDE
jgi:hypothetical protein